MQGYPQQIKTRLPHSTPNIDNYQGVPYTGVPQMVKTSIPTNLPQGVFPGSYGFIVENPNPYKIKELTTYRGARTMKYSLDAGSLLGGLIVGFVAGAVIFTATGRNLAGATAARATSYIQPKR
jgi:hypothetical protein